MREKNTGVTPECNASCAVRTRNRDDAHTDVAVVGRPRLVRNGADAIRALDRTNVWQLGLHDYVCRLSLA